jgi:hypothetical protein
VIREAEWKASDSSALASSNMDILMKKICGKELHRLSMELSTLWKAEGFSESSNDHLWRQIVSKVTELLPGPHGNVKPV